MSASLAKSTLQYLPAQFFGPLVLFATTIVWTHLLDPAEFGLLAFVIAAQELTGLFGLTWWSIFVVRFQSRHAGAERRRFEAMDAFVVVFGVVAQALMAAPVLIWIGVSPRLEILLPTIAFLGARTALAHLGEWSRALHRIGAYTLAQVAAPAIGSALSVVLLIAWKADAATALGAMAAGQALGVIAVGRGLRRASWIGKFDADLFKQARAYGLPILASGILLWGAVNGIRILIEAKQGLVAVGLFSAGWGIGQRLAAVLSMLCTAAAFPVAVKRLESGDRAGALRQVSLNGALMIGLLAPAIAGISVLARPFVQFLIAPQFQETTILVLPLAVATAAVRMVRIHTVDQTGLLLERTGVMTLFNVLDVTLTIAGGAVGVSMGGVVGAAAGCLGGAVLSSGVAVAFTVARLGLPIPAMALIKVITATAVMTAALRHMPPVGTIAQMCGQIVLGAMVYGVAIVLTFPELWRFLHVPALLAGRSAVR